ncbi:uncharacterized protein EURHEDRAFT_164061 [Aspergillus ruber CBS 135680]|uniref:Uncharacterized protein n=1 Tax=Aspergillus ruber (strain CBS 135680) TaxID=1388766 RepID=A0A017S825_ASPRC|nr:uncharacterized protein EURHEDRAFT_164061 [Aspergillus ruber CBS 135680]EYE93077.1 hypothetical protein EURHEDRAFT_164061 [Aspergillus ruber CBS 135680]
MRADTHAVATANVNGKQPTPPLFLCRRHTSRNQTRTKHRKLTPKIPRDKTPLTDRYRLRRQTKKQSKIQNRQQIQKTMHITQNKQGNTDSRTNRPNKTTFPSSVNQPCTRMK